LAFYHLIRWSLPFSIVNPCSRGFLQIFLPLSQAMAVGVPLFNPTGFLGMLGLMKGGLERRCCRGSPARMAYGRVGLAYDAGEALPAREGVR